MYFRNRSEAGYKLAQYLVPKYRYQNCSVVALSDGAVVVGEEISKALHCVMLMLLTERINVPGNVELANIDQDGNFTYNGMYSAGEIEYFTAEYHGFIEQEKLTKLHELNRLLGPKGIIDKNLLRHHNVILVSDGLANGMSLEAAVAYLKPLKLQKLIIATPLASVPAVDRMHLLGDEIYCLSVVENYIETNHYYDDNKMPSHEDTVKTIQNMVLRWA
jgi:putative phosphoribosyl transferase